MRSLIGLFAAALLASAAPAFSQECPEDVGAAVAAACPCEGNGNGNGNGNGGWKNHGQYMKCVVHLRNDLRKAGCLDAEAKRTIAKCAARSTCGKEGAVLCCVYDTSGTCSDLLPGDEIAEGVCSNDEEVVCDTAVDCITAKGPKVSRHPEGCTDRGGTVVGTGSVCGGCPIPPPAP
jgi:hypothetical protein